MHLPRSSSNARAALIAVWFGSMSISFLVILYLYMVHWIEKDSLLTAAKEISGIYAPYVGAITLFFWGSSNNSKSDKLKRPGKPLVLALLLSLFWNGIILFLIVPLTLGYGTIEDSIAIVKDIGSLLSWLVAGLIGYYFANPDSSKH
jgi:hypothetical protein